jgi:putative transposase
MILHVLIAMVAGWLQRHQQQVIAYLLAENRVLKAQLGGRRLRLTDAERRRLAALAHPLDRTRLQEVATIATPRINHIPPKTSVFSTPHPCRKPPLF